MTRYILIHISSTALHLDTASTLLSSINGSDIYKSRSNRMDCNGNPLNHQNTTRLHSHALLSGFIRSQPALLLNVNYCRRFIQWQSLASKSCKKKKILLASHFKQCYKMLQESKMAHEKQVYGRERKRQILPGQQPWGCWCSYSM